MNMQPTNFQTAPVSIVPATSARYAGNFWERFRHLSRQLLAWRERSPRRLRLCETLSLGDRRFVAVLECEGSRFLLGSTPSSIALLARLDGRDRSGEPLLPDSMEPH